jgi:acyl dehydratase
MPREIISTPEAPEFSGYSQAVKVGDTIYSAMHVTDARPTKRDDRGIVFFRNDLTNQRGELVCVSTYVMMMRRRPQ